nr:hybrid signal transduction histidine kinase M [Tanacetum cinerariifolium]
MAGDDTIITNTTPTSTNKIIPFNIPIRLGLEKHNYTSWCSFLKIHLGSLGLKTHIEGFSTNSNDPEWDKQDDLVKVWILSTLEESLQDQVVTTPWNAKALWDHIKDLFHDNKDTRAITLNGELRSIKLGSLTINAYCTKIKAMVDHLANLREKVSDKNLVMYALNGLDTRYKGIARLIRHSQPLPKFETARNMLLLEESNLQEATDQATTYDSSSSSLTILMATKMDTKGASFYLNSNANNLSTLFNTRLFPSVHVGDGNSIPVTNTKHSIIPSSNRPLHLHNVLVTPNIIKNLIFVRQFTRDNNCTIEFDAFGFYVKDFWTRHILLRCDSSRDLYPVPKPSTIPIALLSTSSSTWHQRLGHPGDEVLRSLASRQFISWSDKETRIKSTKRERVKIVKGLTNRRNSPWVGRGLGSDKETQTKCTCSTVGWHRLEIFHRGEKEIIDLNIELGLKNNDPITMGKLQSVTEFGRISQNDKRKRHAISSYVGNRHLVVDVGGHEYGLRGSVVEDDDSTSVGSPFVNDTPGKHFILDFENSIIRSPTLVENGRGLFIEIDMGREQIVLDFENSMVYMLSDKGFVTSIPRTPDFMAVFGSRSAIAPGIDSSAGCTCPLPSLGAIAGTDIPSSMIIGHEKEQARLSVSTRKRHCVSTAGRRINEGPKRKNQNLHLGALSSEGNDYHRNLTASNVRNKGDAVVEKVADLDTIMKEVTGKISCDYAVNLLCYE